jgi:hypothetical protein
MTGVFGLREEDEDVVDGERSRWRADFSAALPTMRL